MKSFIWICFSSLQITLKQDIFAASNFRSILTSRFYWTIFEFGGILISCFSLNITYHGILISRFDQNTIICDILISQ